MGHPLTLLPHGGETLPVDLTKLKKAEMVAASLNHIHVEAGSIPFRVPPATLPAAGSFSMCHVNSVAFLLTKEERPYEFKNN